MRSAIGKVNVGFEIVAQKPFNADVSAEGLAVVGGLRKHADGTWQSVTWSYCGDFDCYSGGEYSDLCDTREAALHYMLRSFNDRGLGRGMREGDMMAAYRAGRQRG